ncbi:SpoIIE family protein phosphatase [Streptomyces nigra]
MAHDNVLLLIDGKGQIIEWEHAAEKRFGCSASEAVGQPAKALFHSLSRDDAQLPARGQSGGFKIKPALQDHCLVWRVIAAEGDLMADMTILETFFPRSSVEVQVFDDQLHVGCTSTLAGERPQVRHPRGAPFSEVCGFAAPEEEAAVARGVLASGIPVENRLVHGAETSAEFGRLVHSISYLPLEDASGAVHGLVMVSVDVTARERERRAQALLEGVRVQMGHRLGLMDVCQEFVQAVAPAFADTAVVELVESAVRGEDAPSAPLGPGVLLRQAAIQGHRPATQAGVVHPLPDGTPFSRVCTDLQTRLVPISAASTWLNGDPSRADIIEKSTAHSLIVSPLVIGHEILGMVSFYRHGADDPFVQDDLAVATAICTHAALCIDRARLAMREWIIMSTVQRKILPGELTDQAFVQLASLHHQGEEGGGAWADAIALPGARTALVVGDVAGKGIPAAVTMGLLRTAIHTLAALDLQPDELLARLGDTTARLVAARAALPPMDPLIHEPLTVSCSIAIYDPVTGACTIARAGLPDPVVIFPDGVTLALSVPPGPALAARDTAPFPAVTVFLAGGSTLVMGTPALAEEVLQAEGFSLSRAWPNNGAPATPPTARSSGQSS